MASTINSAEPGSGLPDFVKDEFDAFLECAF